MFKYGTEAGIQCIHVMRDGLAGSYGETLHVPAVVPVKAYRFPDNVRLVEIISVSFGVSPEIPFRENEFMQPERLFQCFVTHACVRKRH